MIIEFNKVVAENVYFDWVRKWGQRVDSSEKIGQGISLNLKQRQMALVQLQQQLTQFGGRLQQAEASLLEESKKRFSLSPILIEKQKRKAQPVRKLDPVLDACLSMMKIQGSL